MTVKTQLDELQETLDQFPEVTKKIVVAGETLTVCNHSEVNDWLKNVKEKFAVFQREYEREIGQFASMIRQSNVDYANLLKDNVVVSRKQLKHKRKELWDKYQLLSIPSVEGPKLRRVIDFIDDLLKNKGALQLP